MGAGGISLPVVVVTDENTHVLWISDDQSIVLMTGPLCWEKTPVPPNKIWSGLVQVNTHQTCVQAKTQRCYG